MRIRQESSQDFAQVYTVVKAAFATAEHSDGTEQNLVTALRKSDAFIPELSLVADIDGAVVGHILFTRALVGADSVVVLAPLAVSPAWQNRGIGGALIHEGHTIARRLGYPYALVLGSERYYPRFGYLPAERMGIRVPDGMPAVNFMAVALREDAPPVRGPVTYPREFGL